MGHSLGCLGSSLWQEEGMELLLTLSPELPQPVLKNLQEGWLVGDILEGAWAMPKMHPLCERNLGQA